MAGVLVYPEINGGFVDWASITMNFTNLPLPILASPTITGMNSLDYSEELDGVGVHGTKRAMLGTTLGQYTPTASATFYKDTFETLIQLMGAPLTSGYMTTYFNVSVSYSVGGPFAPIYSNTLVGCHFKKITESHKSGGEALTVAVDLAPVAIIRGVLSPTQDTNTISFLPAPYQ